MGMLEGPESRAVADRRRIKSKKPELFHSIPLFKRVMFALERHSFRLPVRRFVIDMFDKHVMRRIVLEDNSDDEAEYQPTTAKLIAS